jgi:hypothetical protein
MLCAMDKDLNSISDESWTTFEDILAFLHLFAMVTQHISASTYPILAGVIPFFNRLCNHLEDSIEIYESFTHFNEV